VSTRRVFLTSFGEGVPLEFFFGRTCITHICSAFMAVRYASLAMHHSCYICDMQANFGSKNDFIINGV